MAWRHVTMQSIALLSCALIAALLAACSDTSANQVGRTQAETPCDVSEPTLRLVDESGRENPVPLRFGSDFAGPDEPHAAPNGAKGQLWVVRSENPPLFVQLQADRLDGPGARRFEIFRAGTTTPPLRWPGGGQGYPYEPTERESPIPAAGCWRISVVGQPGHSVTLRVLP